MPKLYNVFRRERYESDDLRFSTTDREKAIKEALSEDEDDCIEIEVWSEDGRLLHTLERNGHRKQRTIIASTGKSVGEPDKKGNIYSLKALKQTARSFGYRRTPMPFKDESGNRIGTVTRMFVNEHGDLMVEVTLDDAEE